METLSRGRSNIKEILLAHIPKGVGLGIAVSGGKDSICLLHALSEIKRIKKISLTVLHVNHSLRGKESNADAQFVKDFSKKLGLVCYTTKLKNPPKKNIEAWAREKRYVFFSKASTQYSLDWIVTAHTANDLVETHFMRLVTNKELGAIVAEDKQRKLVRPFLTVSRNAIDDYCSEHKLQWREDSSNSDTHFLRNQIRKVILPFLEEQLGDSQVFSLSERLAELADKEAAIATMAEKAITDAKLNSFSFGTKAWVRCLRELLKLSDYSALKISIVKSSFSRRDKEGLTVVMSRKECKNLLLWLERKVQAVTLQKGLVLKAQAGGFAIKKTRDHLKIL